MVLLPNFEDIRAMSLKHNMVQMKFFLELPDCPPVGTISVKRNLWLCFSPLHSAKGVQNDVTTFRIWCQPPYYWACHEKTDTEFV